MVNCCKCNSTGRCGNCACVKANKKCRGCLPSRLGHCLNVAHASSSDDDSNQSPPDLNFSFSASASGPDIPDTLQAQEPLPDKSVLPIAEPNFTWGKKDASSFTKELNESFEMAVHWKRNIFRVPQGNIGKQFVDELARLYAAFADGSALESVSLKAVIVMPHLLLQKPHHSSKTKENISCLKRRMELWKDGDLACLLKEALTIQHRLKKFYQQKKTSNNPARQFADLVFQGKIKQALEMLSKEGSGGILRLDDTFNTNGTTQSVKDTLKLKHPPSQPADPEVCIQGNPPEVHHVTYDAINATLIRSTALQVRGACGPSGLEAYDWRRLCTSFQSSSDSLCEALARCAKRLCSMHINHQVVSPLLACRLIALDKCPGVRPIGIGDTSRRIMSKAILKVVKGEIQEATGSKQLCTGQISGVEAAIHTARECFLKEDTEAVLLIDASNAFNSLNRNVALHNIQFTCPELSTVLYNTYRAPSDLYIDGEVILSQEGTTQGDPLAMPMYALATIPLIDQLPRNVTQIWYADDACAIGSVANLHAWWNELITRGQKYGYHVNAIKTWLVTKESVMSEASKIFSGTAVNITSHGRPYLGSPIGSQSYVEEFILEKVGDWKDELLQLCQWARTQPHAAFTAYTHGWCSRWSFLTRTSPDICHLLKEIEDIIRMNLLPSLTGRPPLNDIERDLLSLPARLGGIGIVNPSKCNHNFHASMKITEPLQKAILSSSQAYSTETISQQHQNKQDVRRQIQDGQRLLQEEIKMSSSATSLRAIELAEEKGASSWLTAIPLREYGYNLHKSAFRDAIALRYGWTPADLPTSCVCGSRFSVEHALSCPRGAFPIIRHNEIRDLTASVLTEVCHDVRVEPDLQPITDETMTAATANTSDGARLDIAMNGFWGGRFERTFVDVRVFNPYAPSNRNSTISTCYRNHENQKKRAYDQRIREVEHATFTPLVLSATGGLARQAAVFYKRLANLLSSKINQPYSKTINWLRCRLSFALLRSAIQCIRGARSSHGQAIFTPQIDLATSETQCH